MRDVSRTHCVALDWLLDRINHKIRIKDVDTQNQFADMWTKCSFTLNIMNNSVSSCSHISKRMDETLVMSK